MVDREERMAKQMTTEFLQEIEAADPDEMFEVRQPTWFEMPEKTGFYVLLIMWIEKALDENHNVVAETHPNYEMVTGYWNNMRKIFCCTDGVHFDSDIDAPFKGANEHYEYTFAEIKPDEDGAETREWANEAFVVDEKPYPFVRVDKRIIGMFEIDEMSFTGEFPKILGIDNIFRGQKHNGR